MTDDRALSVTEAMNSARLALESIRVRVVGEVSEFNDKPGYKAAYFTICDSGAAMSCLMWRDVYEASGINLRCGMQVEVTGSFSAYVPKGRMQFVVRKLDTAGEGRLRMQVAEIARRLEAEGLMRADRKRPIPRFPEKIGVVTSPRGKAVYDVLRTLKRRYPLAEVLFAGVAVEGDGAAAGIVDGLRMVAAERPDVVLLVRGGGSYEDLMPFNDETLARAVATCTVPVVTGIGHEPDTSIADMVSDLRASTPTGAAEAATPSSTDLQSVLFARRRALGRALLHQTQTAAHRVARVAARPAFADPHKLFAPVSQALDLAYMRLSRAIPDRMRRDEARVESLRQRMLLAGPTLLIRRSEAMRLNAARLDDLSPLKILGRGYAVAFKEDKRTVVRSISQVTMKDSIQVKVADGFIGCTVEEVQEDAS